MTQVDEKFAAVMLGLAEVFSAKLTEQRIRLYAQALGDLPPGQLEVAAQRAIRECRYFPTPSELRGFVEPNVEDAALIAWGGFQRAASAVGSWASLAVDDPCAAEAFETVFGSWPEFCALEGPALGARRAEFLAAYRAARRTAQPGRGTLLPGLCERGWVGQLTAGGDVRHRRDVATLTHARRGALPEAREAQDDEAAQG